MKRLSNFYRVDGVQRFGDAKTFAGRHNRSDPSSRMRGYTIIELSIALSILAVIIVGGLLGVQSILRSNSTNNLLKNIPSYMAIAAKLSVSQQDLAVTTTQLADLGAWPSEVLRGTVGSRQVINDHGGRIFVEANSASSVGAAAKQTFVLTLTGIPQQSCSDVVTTIERLALEVGVATETAALTVGPTSLSGANVKPAGVFNLGLLATACASDGDKTISAVMPRK